MKPSEVRNMTIAEIEQKVIGLKEQLFKLREELISGRVERPHKFSEIKKDLARCYTIINEKQAESTK